jgi:hypothetical protein
MEAKVGLTSRNYLRGAFVVGCASMAAVAVARPRAAVAAFGAYRTVAALRANAAAISSVHVYELRPEIRTIESVTPLGLEHFPGVHVAIHRDAGAIEATLQALVTSGPETSATLFDARWGLVYFGHGAVRLFSAYTDSLAAQGLLGARGVIFNNPVPLLAALRNAAH